ncbi:MAG: bifunctional phosphoserine phosphatase/homoserine phosphotransferase ThrH [Deltaproteobacteria bacterium]|nr:bifunctional phosphoserine phosphatase/homoserine phosphotransferase ThrH [Deltaproteobacteria bacterium]
MIIACLDLEGVLIPEIWVNFAHKTGIEELKLTTRDIPDYDVLMKKRLAILDERQYALKDIEEVISQLNPLEGAKDFLNQLREEFQVIILSDTFYQFAMPLMKQLGYPTLFCHNLEINDQGKITNYCLRMQDQKREAVKRLKELNFKVVAAGDSYNDTTMLSEAHEGILFCPPQNVIEEFPQFPVTKNYSELLATFREASKKIKN